MKDLVKKYLGTGFFSQFIQIILLLVIMGFGGHFFLTYLKKEMPLPNIRDIENRVRLNKKV